MQRTICGMKHNRYQLVFVATAVEWFSFFAEAMSETYTCVTGGIQCTRCGIRQNSLQIYMTSQKYW